MPITAQVQQPTPFWADSEQYQSSKESNVWPQYVVAKRPEEMKMSVSSEVRKWIEVEISLNANATKRLSGSTVE